jgi:hypothetical protein
MEEYDIPKHAWHCTEKANGSEIGLDLDKIGKDVGALTRKQASTFCIPP